MALNQESKDKLKALGLDVDALEVAVKSETETEITIPAGSFFTDDTLLARDANKIEEGKRLGITEGKTAGFEIANKTMIEKYGLKDVKKTDEPAKVIEAMAATLSKGDEGLKGQISALQTDKEALLQQLSEKDNKMKDFELTTTLLSVLPQNRTSVLSDNEYLGILKSSVEEIDGKLAVKLNGEVLRDPKTRSVIDLKEGVNQVFASREGWLKKDDGGNGGGRGAGDNHGQQHSGIRTLSAASEAYAKEHGEESLLTPEFRAHVQELAKNKDFNLDA